MKKLIFILMIGSLFGEHYISPGIQVGINSSKEYFFSYQATFGLEGDNGFPGITFGRRHYKTGIKEWNSYNYIDAQITFFAPLVPGIGIGVIYDHSNIFYKYKLFAGWFGLATCDYITFKDKPKIYLGVFGVYPIFEYFN